MRSLICAVFSGDMDTDAEIVETIAGEPNIIIDKKKCFTRIHWIFYTFLTEHYFVAGCDPILFLKLSYMI